MSVDAGRLARIRRHPVKTLGAEDLTQITLTAGQPLPGDRRFAVIHEAGLRHLDADGGLTRWLPKSQFLRGAAGPALQAVTLHSEAGMLRFRHPERPDLRIDPAADGAALAAWLAPLWPEDKPAPVRLIESAVPQTDTRAPYLSILSLDSLSALEHRLGQPIGLDRWRGNLWIKGLPTLAERDLVGGEISLGGARLRVIEPIERCPAVEVSTGTGQRDSDMLAALRDWCGAPDFGIFAEVISGGPIALGDAISA